MSEGRVSDVKWAVATAVVAFVLAVGVLWLIQ